MAHRSLRLFALCAMLGLVGVGTAAAEECSGTITADEAMKAELARYAAQTMNDFAAMEKLFGHDLTYNRGDGGRPGSHRPPALHRHLGQAAGWAPVRVVAVDRHSPETVASGRMARRPACAKRRERLTPPVNDGGRPSVRP